MSRSRWKVPLCCPRCFETGEVILSHQHDGPSDVRVEFQPRGFRVVASDETRDHVDVLCVRCKVSARRDVRSRRRGWRQWWRRLERLKWFHFGMKSDYSRI